jgi:hypothetical protein
MFTLQKNNFFHQWEYEEKMTMAGNFIPLFSPFLSLNRNEKHHAKRSQQKK